MLSLRAGQACWVLSAGAHLGVLMFGNLLPLSLPAGLPGHSGTALQGPPAGALPGMPDAQTVDLLPASPVRVHQPVAMAPLASSATATQRPDRMTVGPHFAQPARAVTRAAPVLASLPGAAEPVAALPSVTAAVASAQPAVASETAHVLPAAPAASTAMVTAMRSPEPPAAGTPDLPPAGGTLHHASALPARPSVEPATPAAQTTAAAAPQPVRYLHTPLPVYPAAARRLAEEGVTLVRVRVSSDGRADQLQVIESSGFADLDVAALASLRLWQFMPARQGGQAVTSLIDIPVRFSLRAELAAAP